jgi:hypothetical protein
MNNLVPAHQKIRIFDIALSTYLILLGGLYGTIAAGQILGFLKLYRPAWAIILSLVLSGVVGWALFRFAKPFLRSVLDAGSRPGANRWLEWACYGAGLLLLVFLILIPLIRWPYSAVSTDLFWDAGAYHFPTAIQMVKMGSAWDLSIAYGDYPFGYESLIAQAFVLTNSPLLFGTVHALIAAFFFFSLWLLACRYTRLLPGFLFLVVSLVLCNFTLFQRFGSDPWAIISTQVDIIGGNDLFLGAAMLSALLFAPIGPRYNQASYSIYGLALASMIVVSTKPNGAFILLLAWGMVLVYQYLAYRKKELPLVTLASNLLLAGLLIFPGILWAVRNFIAEGRLLPQDTLDIQGWSIFNNLGNPFFYNYLPKQFVFLMAVIFICLVFTLAFKKRVHWTLLAAFLVLLFGFIVTPTTAFYLTTQIPTKIAWRFGIALVSFELIALLLLFEPLLNWLFGFITRWNIVRAGVSVLVILAGMLGVWKNIYRLHYYPGADIVMRDQWRTSVGVDGYYSVYDYIQKNVRNSVVWIENGLPFYTYGPGFTNTVTRSKPPDYIVFISTAWNTPVAGYPSTLNTPDWNKTWKLVYEDSQGRVYKRK